MGDDLRLVWSISGPMKPGKEALPDEPAGQVIDVADLLSRFGKHQNLLKEMAEMCLDEYPRRLSTIREAISSGDQELLYRTVHTLKGSVSYFGAKDAFDAAIRVERLARKGDFEGAEGAYAALQGEIDRLTPALARLAED